MTPDEVIAQSRVPNAKSVFVLGCLESRVTLYAQQVRALNLADAILAKGLVRPTGKVAIIGGGAAGMTAAAALALALPELKAVDLFERKETLLHLQQKSPDRYLHPHIYDWPAKDALRSEAGLPILDWRAGAAGEVAEQILDQFRQIEKIRRSIRPKTRHQVTGVEAFPHEGCRVRVKGEPHASEFYDIAILSVGFGYEQLLGEKNHSYWAPMLLSGAIRSPATKHAVLVSGNGDGGLVDFLTAAFKGFGHREICEFVTGYDGIAEATRVLLEIENEVWKPGATLDLFKEYETRLLPALPMGMLLAVSDRLRPGVEILFHTRDTHLFRRDTAVLNRFAAFLAIKADVNQLHRRITLVIGKDFDGDPLADEVRFVGERKGFRPDYRFLRFGVDKNSNFSPFSGHIDSMTAARPSSAPAFRPATPELETAAAARFRKLREEFLPTLAGQERDTQQDAAGDYNIRIHVALGPGGICEWRGDIGPGDVQKVWGDAGPAVSITCDFPASGPAPLTNAIARIATHAKHCDLFSAPSNRWVEFLSSFTGRAAPGPNVEVRYTVRPPRAGGDELPQHPHKTAGETAAEINHVLDLETLTRLNVALGNSLSRNPPVEIGWPIEPHLRRAMWVRWQQWHRELGEKPAVRRRFLTLLTSLDDTPADSPVALVQVGPRNLRLHLLRAVVLALAFAVSVDGELIPATAHPGNLVIKSVTAHASGVAWLKGRELGPDVASHPWTTGLVLLSELRATAAFLKASPLRIDKDATEKPRMDDVPLNEQPIIMGCDFELQQALEEGAEAVKAYVSLILRDRAEAAVALIDPRGAEHG